MSWVESCNRETDKMWYSSFVKPMLGLVHNMMNVTSIVSIEGKICTIVWVIFVVKIFSRVALCTKIKHAEFSFFTATAIYPGSYWAPSHKLELHRPLHTKYLCKCGSHKHKMSTPNSITSRTRRWSNIFIRLIFVHLIFAITRDRENFLPWIIIYSGKICAREKYSNYGMSSWSKCYS